MTRNDKRRLGTGQGPFPRPNDRAENRFSRLDHGNHTHPGVAEYRRPLPPGRAIYQASNQHALFIVDGSDDTPLLIASDRKILIYDPVRPVVLYGTEASTQFSMWAEGDTFKFAWNFDACPENKEKSTLLLDIKSLFNGPSKGDEIVKIEDGKYRLTRTTEIRAIAP